ncbi:PPM-type phosphatase domain-containing protein [Entamoeba marina]
MSSSDDYLPLFLKAFKKPIALLPKYPILPIDTTVKSVHIHQINDPYYISSISDSFAMSIISTYPIRNYKKDGEPIADRCAIVRYKNCTVGIICDGCGWGKKAAIAAQSAIEECIHSIDQQLNKAKNIRDLGEILVMASSAAHTAIIEKSPSKLIDTGATTIEITITIPSKNGSQSVILLIGDCHAMSYQKTTNTIYDICGKWRVNSKTTSCGGRIGAAFGSNPELLQVQLTYSQHCNEELLLLSTDGFHDNFDPHITQKSLDKTLLPLLKNTVTLADLIEQTLVHIIQNTEAERIEIQNKPQSRSRLDFHSKLDHTTILVYDTSTYLSISDINTRPSSIIPHEFLSLTIPKKQRRVSLFVNENDSSRFLTRHRSTSMTSLKRGKLNEQSKSVTPNLTFRPSSPRFCAPLSPPSVKKYVLPFAHSDVNSPLYSPSTHSPFSGSSVSPLSESSSPVGESFINFFYGKRNEK